MSASAVTATIERPRGGSRQALIEKLMGCGFALPAFLLLLLMNILPLVVLAFLSFTDYQLGSLSSRPVPRRPLRDSEGHL